MGKDEQEDRNLPQQIHDRQRGASSSGIFCEGCSRICGYLSFRCFFVLLLSFALLVSGIFWILPSSSKMSGFDAKDEIKLRATVQVCFRLQKPVSQLVPYIGKLEYDIYGEISTPYTKVVILSMHQSDTSNWTDVVFGVIYDPVNVPINSVFLSVLRSSLIELFLQQTNLTLTTSIFGEPFMFEILKFPGGISIIPPQPNFIWQSSVRLLNFTLNYSISEIEKNLKELKDQLNKGLHLRPIENLFVELTNEVGSTLSPPVTVQAFVMSYDGIILPQRLKQLAQAIADSPTDNLGLDNSVFGNVKSVTLSSFLKWMTNVPTPASSPAPTPELSYAGAPSTPPDPAPPSQSPVFPPDIHYLPPCLNLRYSSTAYITYPCLPCPSRSLPPLSSNAPSMGPAPQLSPDVSPSLAYQSLASLSSSAVAPNYLEIWLLGICGFLIFHLICWLQG